MSYQPKPIDTSHVVLGSDISALTELLARNSHELWAAERLKHGWTYGPTRDDVAKKHPCLVPYEELPDSEKQYDRNAAIGALKTIVALGFRIERPS